MRDYPARPWLRFGSGRRMGDSLSHPARAEIACANADEAQQILVEITLALAALPIIRVESSTTAMAIISGEVACISIGEAVHAVEREAPQQIERPRPPQRRERPASWASDPR